MLPVRAQSERAIALRSFAETDLGREIRDDEKGQESRKEGQNP